MDGNSDPRHRITGWTDFVRGVRRHEENMAKECAKALHEIERKSHERFHPEFNLNEPNQNENNHRPL